MRSLQAILVRRQFSAGTALTIEGELASSLFLLVVGSVSVRLRVQDVRENRRIASLAAGTLIGSVSLLESAGTRLVSMFADEDVVCYEMTRVEFERILKDDPAVAAKLLINVGRELARRLRTTFDDFREVTS